MLKVHFLRQTFPRYALLIAGVCFVGPVFNRSVHAQVSTQEPVVITAPVPPSAYEEVHSAYGAPPEFWRSRFSNAVNAYVLSPWAFFFGELFVGQWLRHGPPGYLFTQEVEMRLHYRFNVAAGG